MVKPRFRKERLDAVLAAAKAAGAEVKVDLVAGAATISFPGAVRAVAPPVVPAPDEDDEVEKLMDQAMGGRG